MGRLRKYFERNDKRMIDKWVHYFDIYEHHLNRFVNQKINVLEIGVYHGGSLQMWKNYFGKEATIYGLDILPQCKSFEEEQIKILIGDQGDRKFWKEVKPTLPIFDIIIDDGGHLMDQQKITFEEMFPVLSSNGIYIIEDLHTSYWSDYGGGLYESDSFINYSKSIIDSLNGWHQRPENKDLFTTSIWSMTYYDSVLAIEKRLKQRPHYIRTGRHSF
ncbi:hypothetical protein SAMN05444487_111126 [Marininema mesophilum]|uniref:Methyltransferase domain-containing protein n=1 Tax=Marininema mesophilum TaxID=1048340 RepID=A0A1H2ZMA5_9BACL|nr:class I SAM-dependent methyltransferase [Marininema mesophilum]SDX18481.1 hypothetical protein SAMN05444487_111126 [Marininema mesophilum]